MGSVVCGHHHLLKHEREDPDNLSGCCARCQRCCFSGLSRRDPPEEVWRMKSPSLGSTMLENSRPVEDSERDAYLAIALPGTVAEVVCPGCCSATSRRPKRHCGLCQFVAEGEHERWDSLEQDVDVAMETIHKKTERAGGVGTFRALRKLRDEKRTVVIKDGWTSYHVQVANPPEGDSSAKEGAVSDSDAPMAGTVLVRKTVPKDVMKKATQDVDEDDDTLPPVDTLEACDKAAVRLRELANHLHHGDVPMDVLQKTVQYAVCVLEAIYVDEARRLMDEEDELSEVHPDAVPTEVREWLASTFTRQLSSQRRRADDKLRFRSVAHAIRAGIMVDRIYRRCSSSSNLQMPAQIAQLLKNSDDWSFDVFSLNAAASGQSIRYMGHYLLNRYGLLQKFKIQTPALENFLTQVELGYGKFRNPYHNNMHAVDVTQTVHYLLCQAGLANWLTDVEILATLIAAIIHDYEHTGTTNTFHVMSESETALLYNDRAVLENYHISQAFRVLREEENNILLNLSKEEYREFRSLVIEMVLATDMSSHFQQIKTMKSLLCHSDFSAMDKAKALSLILHCCDISHPSKDWNIHFRWTQRLMEEFFRQGDKENELGIPYSPLCDRNTTLVAESQIGFIDFIVAPSMEVCGDLLDKVMHHLQGPRTLEGSISEDAVSCARAQSPAKPEQGPRSSSASSPSRSARFSSPSAPSSPQTMASLGTHVPRPWLECLEANKLQWHDMNHRDAELRAQITEASKRRSRENTNGLEK